jgi:hypothetical protein
MKKAKLTQKDFEKLFESVKEDVLSEKLSKTKEKKLISFIEDSLKDNPTRLLYVLLKMLAKIDRKIEISIEVAEMYSFATTYCIAKKLNLTEKETNALYDEVDRETKLILEKAVSAKEEMKYIAKMLSLKHKSENSK